MNPQAPRRGSDASDLAVKAPLHRLHLLPTRRHQHAGESGLVRRIGPVLGFDRQPLIGALAGAAVTAGKQIDSFTTVDLAWNVALPGDTTLSLAVLNLADRDPPFARLDQNFDPFTASPLGRVVKIGFSQQF